MNTIGSPTPSLRYSDRPAYVQQVADASNGKLTVDEIEKREQESDRIKFQQSVNNEKFLNGEGTYLGSSQGNNVFWDPKGYLQAIDQSRTARVEHYAKYPGDQFTIDAIDIDALTIEQETLTAGNLKDISFYSSYLYNEVAAAKTAKANFAFTGSWGSGRITHDVEEYVGWLQQAAQSKSRIAPQSS